MTRSCRKRTLLQVGLDAHAATVLTHPAKRRFFERFNRRIESRPPSLSSHVPIPASEAEPVSAQVSGVAQLDTIDPQQGPITLVLPAGKTFTIGRSPLESYTIPLPSVSKRHCRLYSFGVDTGDTIVVLEDLSSNGLVCNSRRVSRSSLILCDHDVFEIGDQLFYFTRTTQCKCRDHYGVAGSGSEKERKLADYSISDRRLGSGAFSVVRLGFDLANRRQAACKAIRLHAQDQSRVLQQIKTEVGILKKVGKHPGINQIYDVFVGSGDEAWVEALSVVVFVNPVSYCKVKHTSTASSFVDVIALGSMAGGDLFEYLARRGTLKAPEAKWFVFQIAHALAHLHLECNIAHRDLKLENVLLDGNGPYPRAQIADFGQAMTSNRRSTSLRGTVLYMAPEALSGRTRHLGFDPKSVDCWSLGIITSMLLIGSHPFNRWFNLMNRFEEMRVAEAILDGRNAMSTRDRPLGPQDENGERFMQSARMGDTHAYY
ncbi:BQ2448_3392 [Microbotryum intermedium]|uniref:non-specific serine/threonine protein kinase n=1 Tax=Microbotryum intermedium TaxID=269621 RepID=A0A238F9X0_9BASI|nr:BQ2448_3392 [Microbotryum intermedium]